MTYTAKAKVLAVATSLTLAVSGLGGGAALAEDVVGAAQTTDTPETAQAQETTSDTATNEEATAVVTESSEVAATEQMSESGEATNETIAETSQTDVGDKDSASTEDGADASAKDASDAKNGGSVSDESQNDETGNDGQAYEAVSSEAYSGNATEGVSMQAEAVKPNAGPAWTYDERYDVIDVDSELLDGLTIRDDTMHGRDPDKFVYIENDGTEGPIGLYWIEGDKYVRVPWTIDPDTIKDDGLIWTGRAWGDWPEAEYKGVNYVLIDGILRRDTNGEGENLRLIGDEEYESTHGAGTNGGNAGKSVSAYYGYAPDDIRLAPATGGDYTPATKVEAAIPATGDPMSLVGAAVATISSIAAFGAAKVVRRRS